MPPTPRSLTLRAHVRAGARDPRRIRDGRGAGHADDISAREGDGVSLPWASITTAALTVALGLGALLVLTSQQMVDAWIGYVPALAPAVPTVLKLLGSARGDS